MLSEIQEFLIELQVSHPVQGVENCNALVKRQKLLTWLEEAMAKLCETLSERSDRPELGSFKSGVGEGVDAVFLCMIEAMESDDQRSWVVVSRLTGSRREMMHKTRLQYLEMSPPLRQIDLIDVLQITNEVEEIFFLICKIEADFNPYADQGR